MAHSRGAANGRAYTTGHPRTRLKLSAGFWFQHTFYLADHLSAKGFHWRKRGKYLYRRSDGSTHRLVFQTSDANLVDAFIALDILFHVVSPEFASWRHQHGEPHSDLISHRSLADLERGVITIEHDLRLWAHVRERLSAPFGECERTDSPALRSLG